MTDISLNNKNYELASKGPIKAKEIKSVEEIKNDLNDDIVVKNKDNKLIAISADELDIKSKNYLKPYIGLPNVGDNISLYADNKKIEGTVAFSEYENDSLTSTVKVIEKKNEEIKTRLDEIREETDELNKEHEALHPVKEPSFKDKLGEAATKTKEAINSAAKNLEEKAEPQTPEQKAVND